MRFQGSICAIVTPFDANGAPDLEAFERLLGLHLAAATDGIVVSGEAGVIKPDPRILRILPERYRTARETAGAGRAA